MNETTLIPDKYLVFASLLVIGNRMETLLSRDFKEFGVTTRQWFLAATIQNVFDEPPTIKAVAREMGSSHQNIKQVALKLQEKGLLNLERDKKDARATRLRMTQGSHDFWRKTEPKGDVFVENMFRDINDEDLTRAKAVFQKMLANLADMDEANMGEAQ